MRRFVLLSLVAALYAPTAFAQDVNTTTNDDVAARIAKLEQEIALLKRKSEVQQQIQTAAAAKAPTVEMGAKGLKVTSVDKKYEVSLRGTFQVDNRSFLNDKNNTGRDELIARRMRPTLEAKAGDASLRLMPDFAGSTVRVFDAHADYELYDELQFRVGKFKTPLSLERWQSASDVAFIERGHSTNLAPNRDFGAMVYGDIIPKTLEYQVGVFNGTADLANADNDADDGKDVVARVFAHPFSGSTVESLQGLGVGVAGSMGDRAGSATNTILGAYRTPGQQDFFRYRSDTYADGRHWRLYPQAYWYNNNTGLLAEYAISNQGVTRGTKSADLQHSAWQVVGSYVLTGEDASFKGGIKPAQAFNIKNGGLGAWEVVARVGQTNVDDNTFTTFADPAVAASLARSYGVGVNWYLSENFKFAVNYDLTQFDGGAANKQDRPNENALFTRAQFRF